MSAHDSANFVKNIPAPGVLRDDDGGMDDSAFGKSRGMGDIDAFAEEIIGDAVGKFVRAQAACERATRAEPGRSHQRVAGESAALAMPFLDAGLAVRRGIGRDI